MKVLWFTPTSSHYEKNLHPYYGGGWIESLEQLVAQQPGIELGLSFFHHQDSQKKQRGAVCYYPILSQQKGNINKLITNWSCQVESKKNIKNFLEVIADFKPDIIQVFGTEGSFARVQQFCEIPVVIHLQGLINPYANAFYPPGINGYNVLTHLPFFKNHFLGNSLLFDKKRFQKQASRELTYFKKSKYLMGRTFWDKSISHLLAPQASYFHVDEILRPCFYDTQPWTYRQHDRLQIVSTISGSIYKGLDLVLKTATLLHQHIGNRFTWRIIGLHSGDKLIAFFESCTKKSCKNHNIVFEGTYTAAQLIESLRQAAVFVHPSYIDNSPNSVCEAQMLGMPVIACQVGGVSTLIDHDSNGILVPPNAPYELASSIIALTSDKNKLSLLGQQARITALARHNRLKTLQALMAVYQTILKEY